jgi:hypothetical protein
MVIGTSTKDISPSWRPLLAVVQFSLWLLFFDEDLVNYQYIDKARSTTNAGAREAGYRDQNHGRSLRGFLSMYHGNRCRIRKGIYLTQTLCMTW